MPVNDPVNGYGISANLGNTPECEGRKYEVYDKDGKVVHTCDRYPDAVAHALSLPPLEVPEETPVVEAEPVAESTAQVEEDFKAKVVKPKESAKPPRKKKK